MIEIWRNMSHGNSREDSKGKTNQLGSDGLSRTEIKSTVELARISATIERKRLDKEMTQKEFAAFMGVTQGMVSKWESRDYNFTIRSLNEICEKLELDLRVELEDRYPVNDYTLIQLDQKRFIPHDLNDGWKEYLKDKGAIA